MDNQHKLVDAFATGLAIPADRIDAGLAYGDCAEWDSVAHMALVTELEVTFDVMLETEDIIAMSSLAEARRILARHGVNF